jgi:hypothetical protein
MVWTPMLKNTVLCVCLGVAQASAATTPVRSSIESYSEIRLDGTSQEDVLSVVRDQDDSIETLGPAVSDVFIDSDDGAFNAHTQTMMSFFNEDNGLFTGSARYMGMRGGGPIEADSFSHTLRCGMESDFRIQGDGMLRIVGFLDNGGPSSISYFAFVQVFSEEQVDDGFDEAFFEFQIFDFEVNGEDFDLQVPLTADSGSYRIMIRMGHIGTTILDASLSEGSVSAFWSIESGDVCVADITGDGALNFNDISAFLSAYVDRDPIADLTGEGDYNFADVSQFLLEYGMGCPE